MLGDPGINLVASRDSPWHGSKKADNEVRTDSWISERVDRERAAAGSGFKKLRCPLTTTDARFSISNLEMHVFAFDLRHHAKSHTL
jgi:hypothetical protein